MTTILLSLVGLWIATLYWITLKAACGIIEPRKREMPDWYKDLAAIKQELMIDAIARAYQKTENTVSEFQQAIADGRIKTKPENPFCENPHDGKEQADPIEQMGYAPLRDTHKHTGKSHTRTYIKMGEFYIHGNNPYYLTKHQHEADLYSEKEGNFILSKKGMTLIEKPNKESFCDNLMCIFPNCRC